MDFSKAITASKADSLQAPKLAAHLDSQDELAFLRDEFVFPTRGSVGAKDDGRCERSCLRFLCFALTLARS